MAKVRTHVMLSKELLEQVDRVAGKRRRSEFIEEAIEDELARTRQAQAFWKIVEEEAWLDVPEWDDPDAWLDESRRDRDIEGPGRREQSA